MNRAALFSAALLLACRGSQEAFGLGCDHPKERLTAQGPHCVHGYFINESDVFFHAGDAADFNQFIAELVRKHGRHVQIMIHNGIGKARSPWDKADRDITTDWSVTTGPSVRNFGEKVNAPRVRVNVWLSDRMREDEIEFPHEAEVVSLNRRTKP